MEPRYLRVTNLTKGVRAFCEDPSQPTAIHPGTSKVLRFTLEGELTSLNARERAGEVSIAESDEPTYRRERGLQAFRPGYIAVSPEGGRPADPMQRPDIQAVTRPMLGGAPAPVEHDGSEHIPQSPAAAAAAARLPLQMVPLEELSDDDLKAFIKEKTGAAPRGTPARATLLARAQEALAGAPGAPVGGGVNQPESGTMSDGSTKGQATNGRGDPPQQRQEGLQDPPPPPPAPEGETIV